MDLKLRDNVVLVTGGTRGIGYEIARQFAAEGARVAICGRNLAKLQEAEAAIRGAGGDCVAIQVDLSDPDSGNVFAERAVAELGRADVLINNASSNVDHVPARLEEASDGQLLERIMGKTMAAVRCSRAIIPHMRRAGGGHIICIGGTSARAVSRPAFGTSARSEMAQGLGNASLANFVRHLAEEVARDRILVNVVHPYQTRTDRHPARVAKLASEQGIGVDAAEAALAATIPIGRMIESADIASLVVFLASPLAGAITGQAIAVDGGAVPAVNY
jgi:3-oxoacyl-[acyl-carrier protein] reductase